MYAQMFGRDWTEPIECGERGFGLRWSRWRGGRGSRGAHRCHFRRGGGAILAARAHALAATLEADGDAAHASIWLRIGRVVAEKVGGGEIGGDPPRPGREVVGVDDSDAVGVVAEDAQSIA